MFECKKQDKICLFSEIKKNKFHVKLRLRNTSIVPRETG